MMTLSTFCWVAAMLAKRCSTEMSFGAESTVVSAFFTRCASSSARFSASRAFFAARSNAAPLSGVPDQPMTRTGIDGGASLIGRPWSSNSARTLAQ